MNEQRGTPSDTRSLTSIHYFSDRELERAIATSHLAFENWRSRSVKERTLVVAAAAARLRQRIAGDITVSRIELDDGLDIPDPQSELDGEHLVFYVKAGRLTTTPFKLDEPRESPSISGLQIGVIFSAEPWTYSYDQLAYVIAPHLLAGNVFLLKHDNMPSAAAAEFERVWSEVGGPIGLCTNLNITHSQADAVIADERVKGIAFRGSAGTHRAKSPLRSLIAPHRETASLPTGAESTILGPEISQAARTIALLRMYKTGRFFFCMQLAALTSEHDESDCNVSLYSPGPIATQKVAAIGLRFAHALAEVGRGFRMPRLPEAYVPTAQDFLNHRSDRVLTSKTNVLSASAGI